MIICAQIVRVAVLKALKYIVHAFDHWVKEEYLVKKELPREEHEIITRFGAQLREVPAICYPSLKVLLGLGIAYHAVEPFLHVCKGIKRVSNIVVHLLELYR